MEAQLRAERPGGPDLSARFLRLAGRAGAGNRENGRSWDEIGLSAHVVDEKDEHWTLLTSDLDYHRTLCAATDDVLGSASPLNSAQS
jgi:hypothetical protein